MFAPSLKLIAITVQKLCAIKNDFLENARSGPFPQIRSHIMFVWASHAFAMFAALVCVIWKGTIFIRILAVTIINFSLAGVWLRIEGGSFSRAAFIDNNCFGVIPLGDIDTFFRTNLISMYMIEK